MFRLLEATILCLAWRWILSAETCRCKTLKTKMNEVALGYIYRPI